MKFSSPACLLRVKNQHPLCKFATNNSILSFRPYSDLFYKLRGMTVYEMGSAYKNIQIRKSQPSAVICQDEDTDTDNEKKTW